MERGFSSEDFCEVILDFLSQNDLGSAAPPPVPISALKPATTTTKSTTSTSTTTNTTNSNNKRPAEFLTEDEQIAAALKASMENQDENSNDDDDEMMPELTGNGNGSGSENGVDRSRKTMAEEFAGPTPLEPGASEPGSRVKIRLADNSTVVRKFSKDALVRDIFVFIVSRGGDNATKDFTLTDTSKRPPANLYNFLDTTLVEAGLVGAQVTMRYQEE